MCVVETEPQGNSFICLRNDGAYATMRKEEIQLKNPIDFSERLQNLILEKTRNEQQLIAGSKRDLKETKVSNFYKIKIV